ncbi:MAG: tetratricopeptide repeat protein [Elusimicrobiota bacterium]|jgi:tetratricopeptide (TPR) repeat protein
MAKSKGHKFFNHFTGWARHQGIIGVERPSAMEEFFINPQRIPESSRQLVLLLFEDWFLSERKLTRCHMTPLELFAAENERHLNKAELAVYRGFAQRNRFGIFKVVDSDLGEWFELSLVPTQERFHVAEEQGSLDAEIGTYLIARLFPFEDQWAMSSFCCALPDELRYTMDRSFSRLSASKSKAEEPTRPRDILKLFMPKVRWEDEGLPSVRARLAAILQRWGVSDITAAQAEEAILKAHEQRALSNPLQKEIAKRAPSASDLEESMEVLTALWNLTLPDKPPLTGPKERMLASDLQRAVASQLTARSFTQPEKLTAMSRQLTAAWLDTPQKELDGKTPRQAILEERKAMGNAREDISYLVLPMELERSSNEKEGARALERGRACMLKGDAETALKHLQKAYSLMKGHEDAFRILENLGTVHAMLGDRKKAIEMLRTALRVNPDYELGRKNLHILETMTPEEFMAAHRDGFFSRIKPHRG